jgi:hypothetical protein
MRDHLARILVERDLLVVAGNQQLRSGRMCRHEQCTESRRRCEQPEKVPHRFLPFGRVVNLSLTRQPAIRHGTDFTNSQGHREYAMGEHKVPRLGDHALADQRRAAWRTRYTLLGGLMLLATAGVVEWCSFGARGDVLRPDGGPVVTVMDFGRSFPLDPLPSGWKHQKFWTRAPMTMAFTVKDGVPSMRFETHDSGSMLFRHIDIDLAAYPMLAWRWYIELPIRSPLDERTREGDDHPARLFLRFLTDRGDKCAMEVIWGNRLKPGDYKYIGTFPHFVADADEDRVGRWFDERIDLARVYRMPVIPLAIRQLSGAVGKVSAREGMCRRARRHSSPCASSATRAGRLRL